MKHLNTYINEFLVSDHTKKHIDYKYFPETKEELKSIIAERIEKEGNECNLNDIDTSNITDMSRLFYNKSNFNGDISKWNVSNVKNMNYMFFNCEKFNCDISNWNVSSVENMQEMFYWCSEFNQDLSHWNISNVNNMDHMFSMALRFNKDLSNWPVNKYCHVRDIFFGCTNLKYKPDWSK